MFFTIVSVTVQWTACLQLWKAGKNLEISGNLLILENSGKLSEFKIY